MLERVEVVRKDKVDTDQAMVLSVSLSVYPKEKLLASNHPG